MTEAEVRERAFAMPIHSPAFPPGPYRFVDREYLIITTAPIPMRWSRSCPRRCAWPIPW